MWNYTGNEAMQYVYWQLVEPLVTHTFHTYRGGAIIKHGGTN